MGRKSKRKPKLNQNLKTCTSKNNNIKSQSFTNEPEFSKLILITDRLSLPAYHSEEVDEEDFELQLDFRPRSYYVSSLCYVCSKLCDAFQFPCNDCHMIVYCSPQHRQQNLKHHKQLCQVLTEICHKNNGLSFAKDLNADEYRVFRVELLQMIESTLGRRMELWEREILLYPKLCRVCHSSNDLKECANCSMEFFCTGKYGEHQGNHADYCKEFKVFRSILTMQQENGFAAPKIPNVVFDDEHQYPHNFDELIKEIFEFGCDYEKIDCASYAALSQAASPALTAFYAIQNTPQLNKSMVSPRFIFRHKFMFL